ncbi:unnamed protein product [Blepharisma stoltei]|uniref:WH1 domain-containing protein n=1 Tax=Blepharisma stoltei TaxID=1481888 RepID=A0AAU9IKJ0_9CILI|nr:unnamed protein product [Blepharisma stoltei]
MSTISEEIIKELNEKIAGTCTLIATASAKLYANDGKNQSWRDSGLYGAICLIIDRILQTTLMRMYDLNTFDLIFETELYYDFFNFYDQLSQSFFCFPIPGGQIGIYFCSPNEAESFKQKIRSFSPKPENQKFEDSKSKNTKKSKKQQNEEENFEISQPYAVQLMGRVIWDSTNKCFNLDQLSQDLKRIFKNAGIRKSELRDSRTAAVIMEEIVRSRSATRTLSLSKEPQPEIKIIPDEEDKQFEEIIRKQTLYEAQMELIRHMSNARKATLQKEMPERSEDEVVFTNYLAAKIAERRAELTKYDLEEESSDWSDSD